MSDEFTALLNLAFVLQNNLDDEGVPRTKIVDGAEVDMTLNERLDWYEEHKSSEDNSLS